MERRSQGNFDDLTLKEVFSDSGSSFTTIGISGFLAMTMLLMLILAL